MTEDDFRSALQRLGLSQSGAARIMGVEDRSVRRWVSGERPVPGFAVAFLALLEGCPEALAFVKRQA